LSQQSKPKKGYKLEKWLFNPLEIPKDWKVKQIDDVFEILISGTNSRNDLNESGDVGYIHYGDIHTKWTNTILDCDIEQIPNIDEEKVNHLPLLQEGDLIIADASEDYEGSGTSCLLKNVNDKKIVAGLHTVVLRNNDDDVSSDFINYLTSIKSVKLQIISYVTGTSVYGLTKSSLKKIKIPFPKFPEQKKIASILENIDNLISSTQKSIDQTKLLKKGLIEKLFTDGLGEKKLKEEKWIFGKTIKIPDNWTIQKIGSLVQQTRKITYGIVQPGKYDEEGVLLVRGQDYITGWNSKGKDFFKVNSKLHQSYIRAKIIPGDILLCIVGAGVGSVNQVPEWIKEANITQTTARIACDENKVLSKYMLYFLSSSLGQIQSIKYTKGSAQPGLNLADIEKFLLIIPPLPEQEKIVSIITNIQNQIDTQMKNKEKLLILKKSLMQKLLTGEVRVKV
jgi:type I restriction enzyme, S subunit